MRSLEKDSSSVALATGVSEEEEEEPVSVANGSEEGEKVEKEMRTE